MAIGYRLSAIGLLLSLPTSHLAVSPMPDFISGLQLSEALYREAVAPILAREFPGLVHSAARIGTGSDVLGFDTARSTDHEWGPRLLLFLSENDTATHGPAIVETLRQTLPREIRGYPTNFGPTHEAGVSVLQPVESGPVEHKIEVTTLPRFLQERLGVSSAQELGILDWLTFSEQALLEVTAGALFHDGLGTLAETRGHLAYYPGDIWLHLLAAQWTRISQQEPFVGRTGEVGDERGSALIAADLVRDVMRLGFLMERRYTPYSKWFGSAFARLACAARLSPHLDAVLAARGWHDRQQHLVHAYQVVATMHNDLGITEQLSIQASYFHRRPFLIIEAGRFADAVRDQIKDERVRNLPEAIGSIDQFVDSTDVLSNAMVRRRAMAIYGSI
ncbi:MAG TPA: DUF4037 domain-containing protein [Thermomicrobiales bacterium]|nr:DUF4037 domain-containing protein [Thermomicrobiales bacterium]